MEAPNNGKENCASEAISLAPALAETAEVARWPCPIWRAHQSQAISDVFHCLRAPVDHERKTSHQRENLSSAMSDGIS